jgi:hypothetical protein
MTGEVRTGQDRPQAMSEIEWLVALEQIRQLKARRDRCIDAHDWDEYEALHAPDHRSRHATVNVTRESTGPVAWTSAAEMTRNVKPILTGRSMIHHSYDPEIIFETPTKARGVWAMTDAGVYKEDDGSEGWHILYGYYYETYEKREGRWVFTERRWQRHLGVNAKGRVFPTEPLKGADAFEGEWP